MAPPDDTGTAGMFAEYSPKSRVSTRWPPRTETATRTREGPPLVCQVERRGQRRLSDISIWSTYQNSIATVENSISAAAT